MMGQQTHCMRIFKLAQHDRAGALLTYARVPIMLSLSARGAGIAAGVEHRAGSNTEVAAADRDTE